MRKGRMSRKRRATIVSSVMPRPPRHLHAAVDDAPDRLRADDLGHARLVRAARPRSLRRRHRTNRSARAAGYGALTYLWVFIIEISFNICGKTFECSNDGGRDRWSSGPMNSPPEATDVGFQALSIHDFTERSYAPPVICKWR